MEYRFKTVTYTSFETGRFWNFNKINVQNIHFRCISSSPQYEFAFGTKTHVERRARVIFDTTTFIAPLHSSTGLFDITDAFSIDTVVVVWTLRMALVSSWSRFWSTITSEIPDDTTLTIDTRLAGKWAIQVVDTFQGLEAMDGEDERNLKHSERILKSSRRRRSYQENEELHISGEYSREGVDGFQWGNRPDIYRGRWFD